MKNDNIYLLIVAVVMIFFILPMIRNFSSLAKREKRVSVTEKKLNLQDRISLTNDFLVFVDIVIDDIIENALALFILSNTKYETRNIDKDIERISDKVFHAIKEKIFSDKDLIINTDYALEYITSKVSTKFVVEIKKINSAMNFSSTGNE